MSAYSWIVILLALGGFGLLYHCVNPAVSEIHDTCMYDGTDEATKSADIIWLCWKYLPGVVIVFAFLYAYITSQKEGGYP